MSPDTWQAVQLIAAGLALLVVGYLAILWAIGPGEDHP